MAKKRMSKTEAIRLAKVYGIKFTGSYHADCSTSDGEYLAALAKLVGYKKPASANGSTARYFYEHLCKKM